MAKELAVNWLEVQVRLDRAGFSPGEIDGRPGPNTLRALQAFSTGAGVAPGVPATSPEVLERLREGGGDFIVQHTLTADDFPAAFAPSIPSDLVEQSALPALEYRTGLEAIAERFHASPALLERLNRTARYEPGATVRVPAVEPMTRPAYSGKRRPEDVPAVPAAELTVSKSARTLVVRDAGGRILLHAPVTTGSEHDPLPIGQWRVLGVFYAPKFYYNPELFWDADPGHAKAVINEGPNNPVGLVWIDIDKEQYGLHGTPEPGRVGHTASHGCVRLTNWDVLRLALLVDESTRVVFEE